MNESAIPDLLCHRHASRMTAVCCLRCDRPICSDCETPAPIGFLCPDCVLVGKREARRLDGVRERRPPRRVAPVFAVLAVVGAVTMLWWVRGQMSGASGTGVAAYPTISQPAGVFATSTTTARPTGPFEGTPAETYPQGADGLTMPAGRAYPGWTEAEADRTLDRVRDTLADLYLDERALVRHDWSTVLPHLAPGRREVLRKALDQRTGSLAVRVSGTVRLAGEQPRVKGRTTVRGVTDKGLHPLEIVTNYVVVYPFDVPDSGPGSRTAVFHFQITWRSYPAEEVREQDQGLVITNSENYLYNVDCAQARRGLVAPASGPGDALPGLPDADNPDSYYDPDRSLDIGDGCGLRSGAVPPTTTT